MKLLTLSKKIEEINEKLNEKVNACEEALKLLKAAPFHIGNSVNESYDEIIKHTLLLDLPLHLSIFVPCKDGKPLIEPPLVGGFYASEEEGYLYEQDLKEAKKAVLFEGFELVNPRIIESETYKMMFLGERIILDIKVGVDSYYTPIMPNNSTVSDFAEATKDNPVTLCKQSD